VIGVYPEFNKRLGASPPVCIPVRWMTTPTISIPLYCSCCSVEHPLSTFRRRVKISESTSVVDLNLGSTRKLVRCFPWPRPSLAGCRNSGEDFHCLPPRAPAFPELSLGQRPLAIGQRTISMVALFPTSRIPCAVV
jgi:hypothetical protein